MRELIELIFEGQPELVTAALVRDLICSSSSPRSAQIDGNPVESSMDAGQFVHQVKYTGNLRFSHTDFCGSIASDTIVSVIRYQGVLDVEVSMKLEVREDYSALERGLHLFANELALRHSVSRYFAGLDPAADEDTRIFTGTRAGPCNLNDLLY